MYYKVFYTDRLPEGFAGKVNSCFIRIRPKYKDNIGLLEHEKKHVEQFWRHPFLHGLLYTFSKRYRCECEIEAYRTQLFYCAENIDKYVQFIVEKYGLDVRIEYIKLRLAEA